MTTLQHSHYPAWAQALHQCGGHSLLSECAQYPFAEWNKANDASDMKTYWQWVWARATEDGVPIEDLVESEDSYYRRTRVLPGAVHMH